jgi:putative restriction endonuclease
VYKRDWAEVGNPFSYAEDGTTLDDLIDKLLNDTASTADVYYKIKARGRQHDFFKTMIRRLYTSGCAFCGLTYTSALEAAHIVPWRETEGKERVDPRNGLLLCSTHHKLFDARILSISTGHTILVNDQTATTGRAAADREQVLHLKGKEVRFLPKNKKHWPAIDYIDRRNRRTEPDADDAS